MSLALWRWVLAGSGVAEQEEERGGYECEEGVEDERRRGGGGLRLHGCWLHLLLLSELGCRVRLACLRLIGLSRAFNSMEYVRGTL